MWFDIIKRFYGFVKNEVLGENEWGEFMLVFIKKGWIGRCVKD